jgi:hypothetical protein
MQLLTRYLLFPHSTSRLTPASGRFFLFSLRLRSHCVCCRRWPCCTCVNCPVDSERLFVLAEPTINGEPHLAPPSARIQCRHLSFEADRIIDFAPTANSPGSGHHYTFYYPPLSCIRLYYIFGATHGEDSCLRTIVVAMAPSKHANMGQVIEYIPGTSPSVADAPLATASPSILSTSFGVP